MNVKIKYLTLFKKITGKTNEIISIIDGSTLEDVMIGNLCERYEELRNYMINNGKFENNEKVAIFINNKEVKSKYSLILKNDDVITMLSPIIGG